MDEPVCAGGAGLLWATVLAAAVVVGTALRLGPVVRADFPLNDGGLFSVMIREVQRAHYALPLFTSYNGLDLPFAYPPLAFYLGAALSDLTGVDPIGILRVLPAILSVLGIGAFFLLAEAALPSRLAAAVATLAFVVLPGSYIWEVMGGGVTRALGMGLALLALRSAYQFYVAPNRGAWLGMALFSALTILAHTEWALFLAISVFACLLWLGRTREGLVGTLTAGAAILLLSAPWWAVAFARFGATPFLAASQTGSWLSFVTSDPGDTPVALLLLLGIAPMVIFALMAALGDRRFVLIGWLGLITMADFRAYAQLICVPAALGTGYAFGAVARRLLRERQPTLVPPDPPARPSMRAVSVTIAILAVVWAYYMNVEFVGVAARALVPLSPDERAPMIWAAEQTPAGSAFLLITGVGWALDRSGEWFPALTGRQSVATVQGSEWIPGLFTRRQDAYVDARRCGGEDAACLDQWIAITGTGFSYVYLAKSDADCCGPLRADLRNGPGYRVVYDGPGATIFERTPAP